MKKFLFTLAALLLAGNAFAYKAGDAVTHEYFYIEPVELTQADIDAGEVEVTVFVHAEAYFNVFMIDIVPPAGLTPVEYWDEDAMTVSYKNNRGTNKTVNGNLAANDEMTRFIATISVGGYWQPEEGGAWVMYGAAKWEAGDYAMFTVLYEIDADAIADGQFYIHSYPASGQDERGYVSDGRETEDYFDVTVPSAPQPEAVAPVFAVDETYTITATCPNDYKVYVNDVEVQLPYTVAQTWEEQTIVVTGYGYVDGAEDAWATPLEFTVPALEPTPAAAPEFIWDEETYTLTVNCNNAYKVYVDGNEVEVPYTVAQTWEEQTIVVTGYGYGEHMTETWAEPATFVIPALEPTPAVAPTFIWDEETYTLTVECPNAYKVYVDGNEVQVPYTVNQTYEEQTITVTGYGYGEHMTDTWADPATYTIPALVPPVAAAPSISVNQPEDLTSATITITADLGATIYYSFDNQTWVEYTNAIPVNVAGDYTVYAYAEGPGMATASEVVSETFTVVEPQLEATGSPSIHAIAGEQIYTVVIDEPISDPDAALWYRYQLDGGAWSEWLPYNGPVVFNEFGTYVIEAYAIADGKAESLHAGTFFTLNESTTAVDELFSGKTVASTRYFNLAGQEMSEANGVCIILTTYTDGSVNAVKVMK